MIHCRLADLNIEINSMYEYLPIKLSKYFADFEKPDMVLNMSQKDIDTERITDKKIPPTVKDYALEITAGLRLLAERLPEFDGVLMHACAFETRGKGIAFGAASGTGKSTHMLLWQRMLGDKLTVINGDKPFVRFVDGALYIYGTPWAGKEGMHNNIKVPLTDICKIKRSETNNTKPLSKEDGVMLLMQQIYMPYDTQMRIKTFELINRIAESVNFWEISCNMDISAAETAYNTILGSTIGRPN